MYGQAGQCKKQLQKRQGTKGQYEEKDQGHSLPSTHHHNNNKMQPTLTVSISLFDDDEKDDGDGAVWEEVPAGSGMAPEEAGGTWSDCERWPRCFSSGSTDMMMTAGLLSLYSVFGWVLLVVCWMDGGGRGGGEQDVCTEVAAAATVIATAAAAAALEVADPIFVACRASCVPAASMSPRQSCCLHKAMYNKRFWLYKVTNLCTYTLAASSTEY